MENTLEIKHDARKGGGRYWAAVPGGAAELIYRLRDKGVIIIDRTFTPPESRGRGVAMHIVERAVADARAKGLKIVPKCPYVARLFRGRADWRDIEAA